MIARVFPRRTKWTPTDDMAFIGDPPLYRPDVAEVHVSCTFTWDKPEAERLVAAWKVYYPNVRSGGPAYGDPGGGFVPGRYVKEGVTITSRGCNRRCKFCFVPKREGAIRTLPIQDGWILQDNNILACPFDHVVAVFKMLAKQKQAIDFNGGLDPRLLREWHVEAFNELHVKTFWLSADAPAVMKYLERAAELLEDYKQWQKRCYVLIGFGDETVEDAEKRLEKVFKLGFLPFAQLYQPETKRPWTPEWNSLQRKWCRPAAYKTKTPKEYRNGSIRTTVAS